MLVIGNMSHVVQPPALFALFTRNWTCTDHDLAHDGIRCAQVDVNLWMLAPRLLTGYVISHTGHSDQGRS